MLRKSLQATGRFVFGAYLCAILIGCASYEIIPSKSDNAEYRQVLVGSLTKDEAIKEMQWLIDKNKRLGAPHPEADILTDSAWKQIKEQEDGSLTTNSCVWEYIQNFTIIKVLGHKPGYSLFMKCSDTIVFNTYQRDDAEKIHALVEHVGYLSN